MNPFKRLLQQKNKDKMASDEIAKFANMAKEISDKYPDAVIILGDPHTDVIFMSHKMISAPIRIVNKDGSSNRIVFNAIKHLRGQGDIDRFLLAVDGGLYAISNALYNKRSAMAKLVGWVKKENDPPVESAVKLTDGSVLSPVQIIT